MTARICGGIVLMTGLAVAGSVVCAMATMQAGYLCLALYGRRCNARAVA